MDPTDTNPISDCMDGTSCSQFSHSTNNLVPGNDGKSGRFRPTLDFIELRVAYTTDGNLNQQLAASWLWPGPVNELQLHRIPIHAASG